MLMNKSAPQPATIQTPTGGTKKEVLESMIKVLSKRSVIIEAMKRRTLTENCD